MALVRTIISDCKTPTDITMKLKDLFARMIETMLEAEMDEHLGYEKHSIMGNNSGNSRNGYGRKTIKSEWGEANIEVPRDLRACLISTQEQRNKGHLNSLQRIVYFSFAIFPQQTIIFKPTKRAFNNLECANSSFEALTTDTASFGGNN